MAAFRDPMVIFGLGLIALGLALQLFGYNDQAIDLGAGVTVGRLSRLLS